MVLFIFYGPKTARRGGRTYKQLPHMQTAAAVSNRGGRPEKRWSLSKHDIILLDLLLHS